MTISRRLAQVVNTNNFGSATGGVAPVYVVNYSVNDPIANGTFSEIVADINTNLNPNVNIYYEYTGNVSANIFESGSLTGSVLTDSNGNATISSNVEVMTSGDQSGDFVLSLRTGDPIIGEVFSSKSGNVNYLDTNVNVVIGNTEVISNGNTLVSRSGFTPYIELEMDNTLIAEVFFVGGGGSGGNVRGGLGAGAGGAGGVINTTVVFTKGSSVDLRGDPLPGSNVTPGDYQIYIGNGATTPSTNGANTYIRYEVRDSGVNLTTKSQYIALGGGGGAGDAFFAGADGGSGGGGRTGSNNGGSGLQPTSTDGGLGNDGGPNNGSGGGATQAGRDGNSSRRGGEGVFSTITGANVGYAGGGSLSNSTNDDNARELYGAGNSSIGFQDAIYGTGSGGSYGGFISGGNLKPGNGAVGVAYISFGGDHTSNIVLD